MKRITPIRRRIGKRTIFNPMGPQPIEVAIQNGAHGVVISEKVAKSLDVIVDRIRQVDSLVGGIATASQEQSQGITQINLAVGQMDKVTQGNAGSAEETAAAAEELNSQSAALKNAVSDLRHLVDGSRAQPVVAQRSGRARAATCRTPRSTPPSPTSPRRAKRCS
eukprot:gene35571-47834_t